MDLYNVSQMQKRYRGILVGCAIGDILGKPVEGWKRKQIQKYLGKITKPIPPFGVYNAKSGSLRTKDEFGPLKYYSLELGLGDYTDDTILTLALAESIAACRGIDLEDVARRQVREYEIRIQPDGSVFGGFGGSTREAFKRLLEGVPYTESAVSYGPGNGPAMKMAPVGMYMHATYKYIAGLKAAEAIGKITHLDPRSIISGVVQAAAVDQLLNNIDSEYFIQVCIDICGGDFRTYSFEKPLEEGMAHLDKGSLKERLEWIRDHHDLSAEEAHNVLKSNSLVFSSYPFALFVFQKYWNDPLEGLIETVNFGGDCNTTGAIYGALAGAVHGIDIFPENWVSEITNLERIIAAADGIYNLRKWQTGLPLV